ncbi:receptor-transporting protein 3-like [Pseudoliparis swirei]|uniref:receptor-transporting protein 3-like n=1 Tax=Pseudoliparis swirei TaxID=2059687 RepID=UPI0024BE39E6|nr:receptor-transporting protein 3-like [Pseudoliparis swirei]
MSRSTDWVPSLWRETFEELLDEDNELDYGDQWNLNFSYVQTADVTQEERKRGWKIYCHSGFGSFECASCHKVWSSARVSLLFRYRLRRDRGSVIMRPFGQACLSCQDNDFHRPGFSTEEVKDVLCGLFAKIRKNCYRVEDDNNCGDSSPNTKRFTKPHEADFCEACQQGICCQPDETDAEIN